MESFKVDIPDEKFAITAFIAGLGVQSKDLMFFYLKEPLSKHGRGTRQNREVYQQ